MPPDIPAYGNLMLLYEVPGGKECVYHCSAMGQQHQHAICMGSAQGAVLLTAAEHAEDAACWQA